MESDKLFEMLSTRNNLGENFFHEACRARSIALLQRAAEWVDQPIPTILATKNNDGEQCTHIIVKCKEYYAADMMKIVMYLGADINGREGHGGFTPLHLCVWEKNYKLAEWLCKVPGINLEAENYAGQTTYDLAYERNDYEMMKMILEKSIEAKCDPPSVKDSKTSSDNKSFN